MIVYLDPDQHGKTGSYLPFWLYFEGETIDRGEERRIRRIMHELFDGKGFQIGASEHQVWAIMFADGWFHLMFRTREDRDLARLAL